jgi:four helix bundle protein
METKNVILEKTIDFSLAIMDFCELLDSKRKFIISNQLLRCGTSIGANVFEAQHAESRADFIHKIKVANKEASETLYWLILCERSKQYPFESSLKNQLEEIVKILSKIIVSSKKSAR